MARTNKTFRLELGFDFNETERNAKGHLALPHFLYDANGTSVPEMEFQAADRLAVFLFDLTEGMDEHAVACKNGRPVTTKQCLHYVFAPHDTKTPPSLDNPFAGCTGKTKDGKTTLDQTETLACEPEIASSMTRAWWGPTDPTRSRRFARRAPHEGFARYVWRLIVSCLPGAGRRSVGREKPRELLNIFLDETFTLTVGKPDAHDHYEFSMRLELAGKIWSFDPQMIVDADLGAPPSPTRA